MAKQQEQQVFTHQFTPDVQMEETVWGELTAKLDRVGYPAFALRKYDGEDLIMLYIQDCLICGLDHALSLSDESLKALIDETVQVAGGGH